MALRPGEYLLIANKQDRTVEQFWLDAVVNMSIAHVITSDEASDLIRRIQQWVDRPDFKEGYPHIPR